MRKIGATKLCRLLALVLALVMGLTALPASAASAAGWEGITVGVLYTDGAGTSWLYPAVQAPAEMGVTHAWWATLPPEALGATLQLQILHEDPAYSYWTPDWSLNVSWAQDKDATSLDDLYAYYVGYSYNGTPQVSQMQDCMKLYLSTMEPPFAYEATEIPGGAQLLPSGDEGFSSQPGAELIIPGGDSGSQGGSAPAPASATLTVYYKHVNGKVLDTRDVTLSEGVHTLWPESTKVGGLNLVGEYSQTVTVYPGGYTDVASITFLYEDAYVAPAEASVEVYYYHQDGYELDQQVIVLQPGRHTIYPQSSRVSGYELVSDSAVTVNVDENGWTDVASVSFIYRDVYVAPVTGEVTVMYLLENGTVIDNQVITLAQGEQIVLPESRRVGDLTLVSDASVRVYVDGGGKASPNPVQFIYREKTQQVQQALVTVFIFDTMGNEIAPRQQLPLTPGTHRIEAPAASAMPGYELMSEAVLEVTVNADGSYTPFGEELSFWYREAKKEPETVVPVAPQEQNAQVVLRYLDSRGRVIAEDQLITLGTGTHTVTPDYAHVPAGYTAVPGTETQSVQVRSGRANPATVSFYFNKQETPATPSSYDVTVYYYDTLGNEIAPRQTLKLTPGTHWVQANPQNLPSGYKLASESAFQLTVYADGTMDRDAADVGFWYAKEVVKPKNAVITVRYVDGTGRIIAGPFSQELTGGESYLLSPDASAVPPAYELVPGQSVTVSVTMEGAASPAVVSFVADLRRESASIPAGQAINRYGVVNANSVALRSEPYSTKSNTVLQRVQKGGMVYLIASEYNTAGEIWTQVIVNGRTGYMKSEFIDVLTQSASDAYAASVGATPVPTFTPEPTPEPTESFVEYITPVPVTPVPYVGYAVLRQETALRTGTGSSEMTLAWLEEEELVSVSENVLNGYTGETWSRVRTLDGLNGYVPASALRQVSEQEAAWRIQYWQNNGGAPAPTQQITYTPEPAQLQGYGLTLTSNVPLRRMASEQSRIVDNLPYGAVVYITGQTYADGVTWQNVAVDGESGYIRSDLVRLMTEREEMAYLDSLATAAPAITPTTNPYDENALSSFGYVTTNNVNFRSGASTSSQKLSTLHTYAMATVLDSERVNGVTWYMINYNGLTGYIHGSYFHQMTLREFSEFYGSDMYRQGLKNNSGEDKDDDYSDVSQEDQVLDNWYSNPGSVPQPSFAPFVPVPTVAPITATATPTLEPLPGYVTQPTRKPGDSLVTGGGSVGESSSDLPLPGADSGVTYPMQNSSKGGSAIVWIVVILLLVLAVGGAVVFMQHQRRKQQIAMRAAQRRAQQARNAAANPYRNAAQPRTGAYPSYGQPQQLPLFPQNGEDDFGGAQAPMGQAVPERPYARQAENIASQRVGRRTARQQELAQQAARQDEE